MERSGYRDKRQWPWLRATDAATGRLDGRVVDQRHRLTDSAAHANDAKEVCQVPAFLRNGILDVTKTRLQMPRWRQFHRQVLTAS